VKELPFACDAFDGNRPVMTLNDLSSQGKTSPTLPSVRDRTLSARQKRLKM
jgi:hypothetical protein